jgi:CBS domain containing-hemolysin-like protein
MEISSLELFTLSMCFLLSGFFSGSEAVLMSVGIDRARQLIEGGGTKGRALTFMIERPSEILATILVGNNIVNILAASLTTTVTARNFENDAVAISVGVTTLVILIFGEVIPKAFARAHAETLSVFCIRVLQALYYAIYPAVRMMVWIIELVLGKNAELSGRMITKNDIEYMISKAEKEKTMDSKQLDLLASILEFPTIKVKDIMITRSKVHYVRTDQTYKEVLQLVKEDTHSRYPVCDGDLDKIIGFMHVRDLALVVDEDRPNFEVQKIVKEPFFVYEHMKIQAVFDYMNRKKVHLALVKDENGLVVGIITLEDIVEEILGEIQDEHDLEDLETLQEYESVDLEEGVNVEGTISLRDLYNDYDIKIPLNDHYSTLAGFILDMLGNNFPQQGQIIVWEGFSFELLSIERQEIKEVRIRDVGGEKHLFSKKDANGQNDDSDEEAKQDVLELDGKNVERMSTSVSRRSAMSQIKS